MNNPLFDLIVSLNSAGLIPFRYSFTSDNSLLLHYDRACVDIYKDEIVVILKNGEVDDVYELFWEDKQYAIDLLKQYLIYDNI